MKATGGCAVTPHPSALLAAAAALPAKPSLIPSAAFGACQLIFFFYQPAAKNTKPWPSAFSMHSLGIFFRKTTQPRGNKPTSSCAAGNRSKENSVQFFGGKKKKKAYLKGACELIRYFLCCCFFPTSLPDSSAS